MNIARGIGLGVGAAALAGGTAIAVKTTRDDGSAKVVQSPPTTPSTPSGTRGIAPGGGPTSPGDEPIDPATDYPPVGEPYPGGGTSPGDERIQMPVRGTINPPGFWNEHRIDGHLSGDRLDARIDPRGWGSPDVELRGRVDYGSFSTRVDPWGWGNDTAVEGRRTATGYRGSVDRPGFFNGAELVIEETIRGASVVRHGRFEETLTPGFNEASWTSRPVGTGGAARELEFDPPGWGNTTRVLLEGNLPAGVEATVATHLFDQWKVEQERLDDYPDTGSGGTSPGDEGGGVYDEYPDPSYPGYPDLPRFE